MTAIVTMTVPQMRRNECRYLGQRVQLTKQEAIIVSTMLVRGPIVTSMELLKDVLWGHREDGGALDAEGSIAVHLSRIRRKLPNVIRGRHGFGWFIDPGED